MPTFRNADSQTRVWPHLRHPETQRSLELAPGEEVELDHDPKDPFLAPTRQPKPKAAPAAVSPEEG